MDAQIRRAKERGHTDIGWLDSWHSFSFGEYYDTANMGIGPLRVLNDDRVAAGKGFGAHPHRDMEIVSYVLEGALAHRDSHGNGGVIHAGSAQFMRAGSGVVHSEMNGSATEPVHFLQVWIVPRNRGLAPAYGERALDVRPDGAWHVIASADAGGFSIDQDCAMLTARLDTGTSSKRALGASREAYLFVIEGEVHAAGETLSTGDAMRTRETLDLRATRPSHVLLFDLPRL